MFKSSSVKLLIFTAFATSVFFLHGADACAGEAAVWQAFKTGGHAILMRHALAPGTGDPADFSLRDCATQRNLSDQGRRQAERIGARLRANGVDNIEIYSSQWCRCLETAEKLALGDARELPILNSFYQRFERRENQTRALKAWLAERADGRPALLVTHQVNISALTGRYAASGELVAVRIDGNGDATVVGSLTTD